MVKEDKNHFEINEEIQNINSNKIGEEIRQRKDSLPNELNYDKEFNLFSQKFKILMTNKEIN